MLRLLLLRHAKAERSSPGGRDISRRLDERGRHEAPVIGAYMARHGLIPGAAAVSPAARTRETWDLVAGALGAAPEPVLDERLYDAAPGDILAVIRDAAPEASALLVVGHNPGLHELALWLIAAGDPETCERLRDAMPTAALAVIEFADGPWTQLRPHTGRLERFVTPKWLAEGG
jgi:phosphohistidine phosphatase